jgi:Fe-S cluster biosynthesis and repair protein YggX
MTRRIHCVKLNKEAEGLAKAPYPGELGQKIYDTISDEAWKLWLGEQTKLINEHRLSAIDPKARAFLREQMVGFLFGEA